MKAFPANIPPLPTDNLKEDGRNFLEEEERQLNSGK